jgi:esterase/lipase superfamily enzyme
MGNRALTRALNNIALRAETETGAIFSQIVLAAPDVDCGVFSELASAYKIVCERATLYTASGDLPVWMSKGIHRYPRAGHLPPITIVDGVDTIDASNAGLTGFGHNYFCTAKQVLGDIYELVRSGTAPKARFGLTSATAPDGRAYWKLS